MKKAIAFAVAGAMSVSLLAGCGGGASSAPAASSDAAPAASSEAAAPESHEVNTTDPITLTISWWGGDSRHAAYQEAVNAFMAKYPNITVNATYGAWSGWEDTKSAALYAGTAEDVMQVNWNWLSQYSPDGSKFVNLNDYADVIDLSNWSDSMLEACTVAGELQAIPVAMTGRIFYWNMNTFKQAGLDSYPTTLDELLNAGKTFQEKLGDDYYPLVLGEYDRMILMTFFLESTYGKPWVENNELQYTAEEVVKGIEFIKSLEDNHVIPTLEVMNGKGIDANNSIDKSEQWIKGYYAGIFEWDSSATKYNGALEDNSGFTVGDEIKFGDKANGGFAKVALGMAITETCKNPVEAAALINFLLNEEEGATLMGTECGMVSSTAGRAAAEKAEKVKPLVKEANEKVMAFVDFQLDPTYESSDLKANPNGVYAEVFAGYSYGDYSIEDAADMLVEGVQGVLG